MRTKHQKDPFIVRFMRFTGKTAAFLGPANREADMEMNNAVPQSQYKIPQSTIDESQTLWDTIETPNGERYAVDRRREP